MTEEIADLIRQLAGKPDDTFVLCTATNVDKSQYICDGEPIKGEALIKDIRLVSKVGSNKGIAQIPKDKSLLLVAMFSKTDAYLIMCDEVESIEIIVGNSKLEMLEDEIRMNDGNLNGLVKLDDLVERLNKIENDINNLKTAATGWTPVAQDGGAALKTAISTWSGSQLSRTISNDLENKKVTQ